MFSSAIKSLGTVSLPAFSGKRIMMMPVILGEMASVPTELDSWRSALGSLFRLSGHQGKVGYLTLDERLVKSGESQRRPGLHVDGIHKGQSGGWGGGSGGGWGSAGNGMILISSHVGCRAWNQADIDDWPGDEGECDHLAERLLPENEITLAPNVAYWLDGLCVHESLALKQPAERQLLRVSMPSTAPWFEGYTANPLGVLPTGEILPRRAFMDQ